MQWRNMEYLYETHCHCAGGSRCAHSSTPELVRAYYTAGYAGLVLTDHFVLGNTAVDRNLPWAEQMKRYYDAYLDGKSTAQELDFDLIFGIEHACEGGEFLCYGIDLDFLLENPDIPELSLEAFIKRVHNRGGLVIQAHPYRWAPAGTPLRLDILDGIEVYNAANSQEANAAAQACATGICTSGGDIHIANDEKIGKAGILLPQRAGDSAAFAKLLRQKKYRLLIAGEKT